MYVCMYVCMTIETARMLPSLLMIGMGLFFFSRMSGMGGSGGPGNIFKIGKSTAKKANKVCIRLYVCMYVCMCCVYVLCVCAVCMSVCMYVLSVRMFSYMYVCTYSIYRNFILFFEYFNFNYFFVMYVCMYRRR